MPSYSVVTRASRRYLPDGILVDVAVAAEAPAPRCSPRGRRSRSRRASRPTTRACAARPRRRGSPRARRAAAPPPSRRPSSAISSWTSWKPRDRPPERAPLLRVARRSRRGSPGRCRRSRTASEMRPWSSARHRHPEARGRARRAARESGTRTRVERELGRVLRAQPELARDRTRREARRSPVGTRKHVIPRGPSPPVRAKTSATDAHVPSVMNVFDPSAPSRRRPARRASSSAAASEPHPGSVSA